MVRTKGGAVVPFRLNVAQELLLQEVERQIAATGRVRLTILKARQLGVSLFIQSRILWRAMLWPNTNAFVLAHRLPATNNLAGIGRFFYDSLPASIRPNLVKRNDHELVFDHGSRYQFSTASSTGTGRSRHPAGDSLLRGRLRRSCGRARHRAESGARRCAGLRALP